MPTVTRTVHARHEKAKRQEEIREPLDGPGPVGRAMATGELVIVPDLNDRSIEIPDRDTLLGMGMQSCIAIPLSIDGTPIGVTLLHADETSSAKSEIALLRQVTGSITFSLQYLHSKESAEYLAYFDTLTALANRTLYLQRLAATMKSAEHEGRGIALIVLDLAGLNVINDGLGHHAGDLVCNSSQNDSRTCSAIPIASATWGAAACGGPTRAKTRRRRRYCASVWTTCSTGHLQSMTRKSSWHCAPDLPNTLTTGAVRRPCCTMPRWRSTMRSDRARASSGTARK